MLLYVARRLAFGLILALLVTMITYGLLSFSFDSVARTLAGTNASAETIDGIKSQNGFDLPLPVQYFQWLGGIFQGDFGYSLYSGEEVGNAIGVRLTVTLSVVVLALLITVCVSVVLGLLAAARGGVIDRIVQVVIMTGYVFPALLIAIALVYIFAINLRWLPATGYTTITSDPGDWLRSVILPAIVLSIGGIANLTSQIRGAMTDELRKDYVRTLRTRGVPVSSILIKHALRNAAGPALTVLSLEFVAMFGGALIIERVFALPGFGVYSFAAATSGDIPVVLALTVFSVMLVITVNLVTDILNGWLNPKARLV